MVLPYACISIIFRKDKLEEKGVLNEIIEQYKPTTPHIDNDLIVIAGAMNPMDAEQKSNMLTSKYALTYVNDNKAVDFVLVERLFGPCVKCDWIKCCLLEEDLIIDDRKYMKGSICYEFVNQK